MDVGREMVDQVGNRAVDQLQRDVMIIIEHQDNLFADKFEKILEDGGP